MLWERSTAKNYCPVSFLSVVSKVFEKLINNKDEKFLYFSGFPDFMLQFMDLFSQLFLKHHIPVK